MWSEKEHCGKHDLISDNGRSFPGLQLLEQSLETSVPAQGLEVGIVRIQAALTEGELGVRQQILTSLR